MKTCYHAGIDYHKHYSRVCVLDTESKVVLETTVRPNGKQEFHALFSRLDGPVKVTFSAA